MNIFAVDRNPVTAAQMLCDKHVVKMILESAQIMSTIHGGPYKPTHASHPCVLWAKKRTNYEWLAKHALALCQEYTARYHKIHKSQPIIEELAAKAHLLPIGCSDFVQCMPEQYRDVDPVYAYRKYYCNDKAAFAVWKDGNEPWWWQLPEFAPEAVSCV